MTSYVVWEWVNDNNISLPYSSEVSDELEKALVNNTKEVLLGQVDSHLEPFKVSIPLMVQISSYNGRNRAVKRTVIGHNNPLAKGWKWEWNFHHEHWFPYAAAVAAGIQKASDAGFLTLQLPLALPGYNIDLSSMTQTNTTTGYQRKVRRVQCSPYNNPATSSSISGAHSSQSGQQQVPQQQVPQQQVPQQQVPKLPTSKPPASQHPAFQPPTSQHKNLQTIASSQPSSSQTLHCSQPISTQTIASSQPSSSQTLHCSRPISTQQPGHLSDTLKGILTTSCSTYQPSATPDTCPVCQNNVSDASDYTTDISLTGLQDTRITLSCTHHIHTQCLHAMITASNDNSFFTCPQCQKNFGVRSGNQPTNGRMSVKVDESISLAGFESTGTIIVSYSFSSGVQDGVTFTAQGFPRVAYIPDNTQGNHVVDLLKEAFKRRLIFTLGTSSTTGHVNCVVWNDIHHKTSTRRGDAYGYPDPGYLDRVTEELKIKGLE